MKHAQELTEIPEEEIQTGVVAEAADDFQFNLIILGEAQRFPSFSYPIYF